MVGSSHTLLSVLEEHADAFKDEFGKLQGVEAKIYVEEGARPRFEKFRPVPFAIREMVEKELARLQALGVIQPVRFSDWAAPIVPVLKSDGRVRICGDYKVTINGAARLEKYPSLLQEAKHFRNWTCHTPTSKFRSTKPLDDLSPSTPTRDCSNIDDFPSVSPQRLQFSRGSWRISYKEFRDFVSISTIYWFDRGGALVQPSSSSDETRDRWHEAKT